MFFLKRPGFRPHLHRLEVLRFSLNAPEMMTEGLPCGPAQAVILVGRDPEQRHFLEICVRSVESRTVAAFGFEGDLERDADLDTWVDGALTFAEGMGFLFGDDALCAGDEAAHEKALGHLLDFLGDSCPTSRRARPAHETASRVAPALSDELLLDEVVGDPVGDAQPDLEHSATGPTPVLSKFRGKGRSTDAGVVLRTPGGTAVGRVRLVKKRLVPEEGRRAGFLFRLLRHF